MGMTAEINQESSCRSSKIRQDLWYGREAGKRGSGMRKEEAGMERNEFCDQLNDLLLNAYNTLAELEEKKIQKNAHLNISLAQLHLMQAIGKYGEGEATISDIAKDLSFAVPTVTVAINKLEKKGYVIKQRSREDKRVVYVTLSRQGRKIDDVHRYIHKKMSRELAKNFDDEEQVLLLKGLEKMIAFFQEYLKEGEE